MTSPKIVAHRGYSARFPENTVAAARAAIAAGSDFVEADARFSADGTLFCFHDATLARLTGATEAIAESSDAALGQVRYRGEAPARFAEIVAAISGRCGLLVDVKLSSQAMLLALHGALETAGWPADVWLGLRDAGQTAAARAMFEDRVGILALLPELADAEAFLAAGAAALRVWEEDIGSAEVQLLKSRVPIWVTAGKVDGRAVGDLDADARARVLAFEPAAVLVNDPVFLAGRS